MARENAGSGEPFLFVDKGRTPDVTSGRFCGCIQNYQLINYAHRGHPVATRQQVADFLEAFRRSMADVGWLWILNRDKNRDGLIAIGITKRQREKVVRSLTPEDYCEGPVPDPTQPGDIWIFGKQVEDIEIYIKLKLTKTEAPKCLSFHPAEHALRYPLRKKKEGGR